MVYFVLNFVLRIIFVVFDFIHKKRVSKSGKRIQQRVPNAE
jgi:hypothetical protein